jgi:hemoglobin
MSIPRMPFSRRCLRHLTAVGLTLALGCLPARAASSLYDRLGGEPGVATVVSDLVEVMRTDPVSGHIFRKVNHKRLKAKISEQICTLTGGPCAFDGDDMKTTHAGIAITETDFHRLVEHLVTILDRRGVGTREKNELLAILAPFKRDVVTR